MGTKPRLATQRCDEHGPQAVGGTLLGCLVYVLPLLAKRIDMADHDDSVEHGDSEECNEADARRKIEVDTAKPERGYSTHQRERHDAEDQEHLLCAPERGVEQRGDDKKRDGKDDQQTLLGSLLILVLSTPLQTIAGRQRQPVRNGALAVLDEAAEVTPADITHHDSAALRLLAVDQDGGRRPF